MSLAADFRLIEDTTKVLCEALERHAVIEDSVFFDIPPVTKDDELKYQGRTKIGACEDFIKSHEERAAPEPRTDIISTKLVGEQAFNRCLKAFRQFSADKGMSSIFFPVLPGFIVVPDIHLIAGYVAQAYRARKLFKAAVIELKKEERYKAVHDIDSSLVTKMLYRQIKLYDQEVRSIYFNYARKASSTNYDLASLIEGPLTYSPKKRHFNGSEEASIRRLSELQSLVENEFRGHLFRTHRRLGVQIEVAVRNADNKQSTGPAGLPIIVPNRPTKKYTDLGDYHADIEPHANFTQHQYEWTCLADELDLYRTVSPLTEAQWTQYYKKKKERAQRKEQLAGV